MAAPTDEELVALLRRFVCVRLVQMWDLDLDRFQFDGFLSWTVQFMNADDTIYGRFGTRSVSGNRAGETKMTLAGFKKTLARALAVHERYVASPKTVGPRLAAKVGAPRRWKRAQDIPIMRTMFPRHVTPYQGGGRHGHCVHCHMVQRSEAVALSDASRPVPDRVFWPYPLPQEIGMEMDPSEAARILKVRKGSPAAGAGFRPGDVLEEIDRQPILSTADIQWVLHDAASPAALSVRFTRAGRPREATLALAKGWRSGVRNWSYLHKLTMADMTGFLLWEADAKVRAQAKLPPDTLALVVRDPIYWRHRPRSPLEKGDVIVEVDGSRAPLAVTAFTARLYRAAPHALKVVVVRDGKELTLAIKAP